jgi:hypothetical protein
MFSMTNLMFLLLTKLTPLHKNPSWEANSSSATQEIPSILWRKKAHYRIHNSPPHVLSSARVIQSVPPSHFSKINFNITLPSMPRFFK